MRDLKQRFGTAIILITHDLGVVAGLADRVLVMQGGELKEQGAVDDIFYRPPHEYTRALLAAVPRLDAPRRRRPIGRPPRQPRRPPLVATDLKVAVPGARRRLVRAPPRAEGRRRRRPRTSRRARRSASSANRAAAIDARARDPAARAAVAPGASPCSAAISRAQRPRELRAAASATCRWSSRIRSRR